MIRNTAVFALAAGALYATNVGLAPYGLGRFPQVDTGNIATAIIGTCQNADGASVTNCRVEVSWLMTFTTRIDTTNTENVITTAMAGLPVDAILTVTTALGFKTSEGFQCSAMGTDTTKLNAEMRDDKTIRASNRTFNIPSMSDRVTKLTSMMDAIRSRAQYTTITKNGATTTEDRRAMLRFVVIPMLEDVCNSSQYKVLRNWVSTAVSTHYRGATSKPSVNYRRSPNDDWATRDKVTPRVTGSTLELHGPVSVTSRLTSGDAYNPDGSCIDWGASTPTLHTRFTTGTSVLYWEPEMNGRSSCGTTPTYPQFDPRRSMADAFTTTMMNTYLTIVRAIRDGR